MGAGRSVERNGDHAGFLDGGRRDPPVAELGVGDAAEAVAALKLHLPLVVDPDVAGVGAG